MTVGDARKTSESLHITQSYCQSKVTPNYFVRGLIQHKIYLCTSTCKKNLIKILFTRKKTETQCKPCSALEPAQQMKSR